MKPRKRRGDITWTCPASLALVLGCPRRWHGSHQKINAKILNATRSPVDAPARISSRRLEDVVCSKRRVYLDRLIYPISGPHTRSPPKLAVCFGVLLQRLLDEGSLIEDDFAPYALRCVTHSYSCVWICPNCFGRGRKRTCASRVRVVGGARANRRIRKAHPRCCVFVMSAF